MQELQINLTEAASEADRNAVFTWLRDFNAAANPEYWQRCNVPDNAARPLELFVRDSAGNIIGGLIAETQFAWLKIAVMAVAPAARGRHIGSQLVRRAESEAVRRGCRYVYVDTMQYQCPKFYEALGYGIVGVLHDWDSHGHAKYLLTKELSRG